MVTYLHNDNYIDCVFVFPVTAKFAVRDTQYEGTNDEGSHIQQHHSVQTVSPFLGRGIAY